MSTTTNPKATAADVQGGAVCVWDAFGEFWCEGGPRPSGQLTQPSYITQGMSQGNSMIFEGFDSSSPAVRKLGKESFCGCGAEAGGV